MIEWVPSHFYNIFLDLLIVRIVLGQACKERFQFLDPIASNIRDLEDRTDDTLTQIFGDSIQHFKLDILVDKHDFKLKFFLDESHQFN
jgi:hypothetical protein